MTTAQGEVRPRLTIFRGLPGSGKSTAALSALSKSAPTTVLIEPDSFCMEGGEYRWTKERWAFAVKYAQKLVAMFSGWSMNIIYADVLPKLSDVEEVIKQATGYEVIVIDMPCTVEESLKRNIHNVDSEHIERMYKEWKEWPKTK